MGERQYWSAPIPPLGSADGPAATAAALTDASPSPQVIIPALMMEVGTRIRVSAYGQYTSTSATPTLVAGFYTAAVGTAIGSSTPLGATAALPISATAAAWPFMAQYTGQCRALGTAGVIVGQGFARQGTSLTVFSSPVAMPITAAARTIAYNTTINQYIAFGITWSSITGSPSFTCNELTVELIG